MSASSSPTTSVTSPRTAPERSWTSQPRSIVYQDVGAAMAPVLPESALGYRGAVGFASLIAALLAVAAPSQTIGHSVEGRSLQVVRVGSAKAPVRVLVVGQV